MRNFFVYLFMSKTLALEDPLLEVCTYFIIITIIFVINSHAVGVRYCLRCRYDRWAAILVVSKTSFDWAPEKLSHVWVRLFLKNLKIVESRDRTHAESEPV